MDEQTDRLLKISDKTVKAASHNTCIDRLIQYTISP